MYEKHTQHENRCDDVMIAVVVVVIRVVVNVVVPINTEYNWWAFK